MYLEDLPRGTGMDPQGLVQRIVERGAMVPKLLPERLLGLGLVEVGWQRAGLLRLPLCVTVPSGAGGPARDDEASALCVGCRGNMQPSSRITNTPITGSGAGAGQFSHWPHPGGGASSSGISTTST
jgi:hypothetical protein